MDAYIQLALQLIVDPLEFPLWNINILNLGVHLAVELRAFPECITDLLIGLSY